jgi:hypothetical protein
LAPPDDGPPDEVAAPDVIAPVVAWLLDDGHEFFTLEEPVLVLAEWDESAYEEWRDFGRDSTIAALGELTSIGLEGELDEASRSALEQALGDLGPPEYVATVEDAQDPEAPDHLGCLPYRDGATLLTLSAPQYSFIVHAGELSQLIVNVGLSRDCTGAALLLELNWDEDSYIPRLLDGRGWAV